MVHRAQLVYEPAVEVLQPRPGAGDEGARCVGALRVQLRGGLQPELERALGLGDAHHDRPSERVRAEEHRAVALLDGDVLQVSGEDPGSVTVATEGRRQGDPVHQHRHALGAEATDGEVRGVSGTAARLDDPRHVLHRFPEVLDVVPLHLALRDRLGGLRPGRDHDLVQRDCPVLPGLLRERGRGRAEEEEQEGALARGKVTVLHGSASHGVRNRTRAREGRARGTPGTPPRGAPRACRRSGRAAPRPR